MSTNVFENLEQALQFYVDGDIETLKYRLATAAIANAIRTEFGDAGLKTLAQTAHKKVSTLMADIAVYLISDLLNERPVLTWIHLQTLRLIKDKAEREQWADKAVDENWSPADLRRAIAASKRQPQEAAAVLAKAASWAEKGKSVLDQAEETDTLDVVLKTVESVYEYGCQKSKA